MTLSRARSKYNAPGSNPLKVRCGEWDTQQTIEPAEHQDRDVAFISVHPGFAKNLTNNVALLHMAEDFILSAHVDVICLPNLQDLQRSYGWDKCIATGWGKDRFGKARDAHGRDVLFSRPFDVFRQGRRISGHLEAGGVERGSSLRVSGALENDPTWRELQPRSHCLVRRRRGQR